MPTHSWLGSPDQVWQTSITQAARSLSVLWSEKHGKWESEFCNSVRNNLTITGSEQAITIIFSKISFQAVHKLNKRSRKYITIQLEYHHPEWISLFIISFIKLAPFRAFFVFNRISPFHRASFFHRPMRGQSRRVTIFPLVNMGIDTHNPGSITGNWHTQPLVNIGY